MEEFNIFEDIARRTGGDVYIGVVGPVRSGKSTLIKKFMELLVIPNITEPFERERAIDEMPQSAGGRMVMTTEPKFIPSDGVNVELSGALQVRVRLVDSVGFPVEGALGYTEEDGPRMVRTPWFDYDIPFEEAAEVGTRKVIADHSTIGLVVTADGTFGEIPRENYEAAERRAIQEIRDLGKPFLVLLNTARPFDPGTRALAARMEDDYGVTVMPANIARLDREGVTAILEQVLYEFPVQEVHIPLPGWVGELDSVHPVRRRFEDAVAAARQNIRRVRDVDAAVRQLGGHEFVERAALARMDLGTGTAEVELEAREELFYKALQDITGVDINDKQTLMRLMRELVHAKAEFDKVGAAWRDAGELGYGIVFPGMADMNFEEPELVRKGNQFGVRLQATAASYHIVRADVRAEYTPILGTEKQSEELMNYLMEKFEDDPRKIWESNIFGKSLNELLRDGIRAKIERMPENAQKKFQETLQRVVNEGGGVIFIII